MRLALEVRYLERCLERGGKYRFLRLETEKLQGWNGEFMINLPDGKSYRWCAKEHPHMHGIVCVERLGVTRTIRVGGTQDAGRGGCARMRVAEHGPGPCYY